PRFRPRPRHSLGPRGAAPTAPRRRSIALRPRAAAAAPTRPPGATSRGREPPFPGGAPNDRRDANALIHARAKCRAGPRSSDPIIARESISAETWPKPTATEQLAPPRKRSTDRPIGRVARPAPAIATELLG